jgi:rod shape-determining protein MreD
MGRDILIVSFRFILLILLQVLIFNKLNLFDAINPLIYILFVLFFPASINKNNFLIISFFFGLVLDFFDNTGGAHAVSCLFLAYIRPIIMKFSFGLSFEFQTIKIIDKITPERITYFATGILIHHLIFFSLEIFRLNMFLEIVIKSFLTALVTLFFSVLIILILRPRKN